MSQGWAVLEALVLIAVILLLTSACALTENPYSASALARRQQAVQDCILSGGHPVLAPSNQIVCR